MLTFGNTLEEKQFLSFLGMMKRSNGFFKSAKQRDFLLKVSKQENSHRTNLVEEYEKFFGVKLEQNEYPISMNGYYRWASYGSRSEIPTVLIFILDSHGVKKYYKIGGHGNLRIGWSPDPKKCKLAWERAAGELPVLEEAPKIEKSNKWLAQVGEKIEVTATIKRVRSFDAPYGYRMVSYLTTLEDTAGNVIVVWKFLGEEGETVSFTGKVKELSVFKGRKQTVVTRTKVI